MAHNRLHRLAIVPRFLPVVAVALALIAVAGAQAHAHYNHSTPSPEQVLPAAPDRVDIYTDQDMAKITGKNTITVSGPNGAGVDDGVTVVDDANHAHFSVGLKPNLPGGRYVVAFQTLSDQDGDTDHGRFAFYIGAGPTAPQQMLDTQLTSSQPAVIPSGKSHTGLYIASGAAVVVLAAAGSLLFARRPMRA